MQILLIFDDFQCNTCLFRCGSISSIRAWLSHLNFNKRITWEDPLRKIITEDHHRRTSEKINREDHQRRSSGKINREDQQRRSTEKINREDQQRRLTEKINREDQHRRTKEKINRENQQRRSTEKIDREYQQRIYQQRISTEKIIRERSVRAVGSVRQSSRVLSIYVGFSLWTMLIKLMTSDWHT